MKIPKQKNVVRLLLFIVATALIVYFLPRIDEHSYSYEVNRPWSYSLLTAPFDIPIHLDSIRAREVKDSIDEAFVPVYTRQASVTNGIMESFRSGLTTVSGISSSERTMLERHLKTLLDDGIVDQNTYNLVVTGHMPYVRTLKSNVVQNQSTASYRSPRRAYAWLDSVMSSTGHHHAVEQTGLSKLMTANVVYDSVASRRILDDAYQKAMAPVGVVQQGERIIDRGDIITPQLYTVLRTYERMTAEKGRDNTSQNLYPLVGQTLYVILLLGCVYGFLFFFRRRLFNDFKVIGFLLSMIVVFTIFGFIMSGAFTSGLYIVPFTMVPIMVVAFFDGRTALFCHLVTVLLCAVIASYPLEFIYIQFVGGVIAINSLKELSRRSQLLRTAVLVLIGYSLSYVAMEVMQSGSVTTLSTRMFGYFLINVVFVSFAYVLVFVFEKLFGFTSVVALVELSDINNPVLRELSEECPGTFQHSMSVSNLASEAAHQIGANVQLVRAGALYHDIGKIDNPAFFTENQHGVNPHDALDSIQSARVVIQHVTDGLRRADKMKLPTVIKNFISQHHGKGRARYFYNTYAAAHPDEDVDPAPFTYPGPNPTTRETSLMMMADAVEAASRSLKDYSPGSIAKLVNGIIDTQIAEGLHNDSPLSFRDVQTIKDCFIQRLRTIYHSRVAYPADPSKSKTDTAKQETKA